MVATLLLNFFLLICKPRLGPGEFPVSWWNTKHQHTSDVILMFLPWKLCRVLLTLQETTGGIGQEKSASGSIMFCEYFICRLIKRTLNFWQTVLKLVTAYWAVENRPPPSMLVWGTIPLRSRWKSNTDLTLYRLSWRVQLGKSRSHVWVQPHICITSLSKSCCCSVNGEQTGMFQDIFVASWSKLVCIFEVPSKMIEE